MPTDTTAALAAESQLASANMTVGALGKMLNERRSERASSARPVSDTNEAASPESQHTDEASDELKAEITLQDAAQQPESDQETVPEAADDETEASQDESTDEEPKGKEKVPKAIRDLQKRVNKLTGTLKEAEKRLVAAEQRAVDAERKLAEPAAAAPSQKTVDPLEGVFNADREILDIDAQVARFDQFAAWAEDNSSGGTWQEKDGKSYELSAEDVRAYRLEAQRTARRLESRREARMESLRNEFKTAREKNYAQAVKLYPWIEQKASAEFQEAVAILRANPQLMRKPDFELVVARMVVGERLEREALKKAKLTNGKPTRPAVSNNPPPVVTQTPSAAPKADPGRQRTAAAEQAFQQSGRVSDLALVLAQRKAARAEAQPVS
jgi:hypothetical protein